MAKLLYQGHGSFRLTADDGRVIYVDPYAGKGYELPADFILVTHAHHDHTKTELCAKKPACRIITYAEALKDGKYHRFDFDDITIEATEAYNKNHNKNECVGYLISLDGKTLYASGDTSRTKQMEELAGRKLDYALFCGDGIYNMNPAEAAECARLVGAKNNILIHMKPGALFDRKTAENWDAPEKIIIEPEEEISL